MGRGSHGRWLPGLPRAPVAAHDELDIASVQFLPQQSLLARAKEEEEAREQEEDKRREEAVVTRMQRLEAEVIKYAERDRSQLSDLEKAAVTLVAHSDALRRTRERRRKRKKKRKKRLPRTCGRARHRQRQWLAPGWFSVFPSFVGRSKLPGIIVGMVQDDSLLRSSSTPAVAYAGLGFTGISPRAVVLVVVFRSEKLGITAVMD